MGNLASKTFTGNGTWVAPAGVTSLTISAQYPRSNSVQTPSSNFQIDQNGNLYAWGDNTYGQLGVGDVNPRSSPTLVLGGIKWASIAQSNGSGFPPKNSVIGIDVLGRAYGWGNNVQGSLGVGDVTPRSSPVAVLGGLVFSKINTFADSSGNYGAIGIASNGQAYGWGINSSGRLGLNDTTSRSSPVLVVGGLTWSQIVMLQSSTIGLSTNGNTYGWGLNTNGQLGIGNVTTNASPVQMVGGVTLVQLIQPNVQPTSLYSFAALDANGSLYMWGNNLQGQLGTGDILPRSSPVAVVGGLKFQQILQVLNGGTISFTMGLTPSGQLYGWGSNEAGELGQGNSTAKSSPVAVVGGLTFAKVFGDDTHSVFGIQTDGTMYAWGKNAQGQLGIGSVTDVSSPVQVVGGLKWQSVSSKFDQNVDTSTQGISASGAVYGWGSNFNGEVGSGSNAAGFSSPVKTLGSYSMQTAPMVQTTTMTVVPGTSYAVNMNQQIPMVGSLIIGNGVPSMVTLSFEE